MTGWADAWENPRIEVKRAVANENQVAAWLCQHGRGRLSGIEGDVQWAAVCRIQEGRVTHYREFGARWEKALEAVGLRE